MWLLEADYGPGWEQIEEAESWDEINYLYNEYLIATPGYPIRTRESYDNG